MRKPDKKELQSDLGFFVFCDMIMSKGAIGKKRQDATTTLPVLPIPNQTTLC